MLDVRGVFYFVNCQPHKLGLDFGRFSFQLSTFNFNLYLGGYSAEVPPLPIPNRVVKLSIADGTALRCGRVGSRHFRELEEKSPGSLVFCVGYFTKKAALLPPSSLINAFLARVVSLGAYATAQYDSRILRSYELSPCATLSPSGALR